MSTPTIDYAALAQKNGGSESVDYAALAAKHGGAATASPTTLVPVSPSAPTTSTPPPQPPQSRFSRQAIQQQFDQAIKPEPLFTGGGPLADAGRVFRNAGGGFLSLLSPLVHPADTAKAISDLVLNPTAAGNETVRNMVEPLVPKPNESGLDYAGRQLGNATAAAGSMLGGEATGELGAAVAPKVVAAVTRKAPAVLDESSGAAGFSAKRTVPGENYTPRQSGSHAAVIAEGSGGGDAGYIPKDIAQATGSKLRATAASSPDEVKVIRSGSPEEAYAAHQSILQKAKEGIDQRHEAALAPVADTPVDMKSVQSGIEPSKYEAEGMDAADLNAIKDLQQRAGNIQTLRGLNEFRKTLNTEDTTLRNAMAPGKSALYPQTVHNLANQVREAYYDALENATGQDFTPDKRLEGNIIAEQRGAMNSGSRLATGEAKASAPQTGGQLAADLIEGAGKGRVSGVPVLGAFANRLRGTKLGQIQQHLQRFYSDLPEAPTPSPSASVPAQPAPKALPNPQLRLPAEVPANAEDGGLPSVSGATPAPAGFNVSPAGEVRPGAPTPATPSILTPAPDATLQLPAEASSDAYGARPPIRSVGTVIPPKGVIPLPPKSGQLALPNGEGNPEFVTPPPSPPPAANAAEATTRTRPPLAPNPQPTPPGRTVVTPEGTAIPQRLQLPAPIRAPKSGKTVGIGDTVTVNGRTGKVKGMNAQTGKIMVDWSK